MSNKKAETVTPEVVTPITPTTPLTPPVTAPKPVEKMSEPDKLTLELAKSRKLIAVAEAKAALAQSENAELQYKYVVLQIYMKYGLNEADAISETGEIHRGAAAAQKAPQ